MEQQCNDTDRGKLKYWRNPCPGSALFYRLTNRKAKYMLEE
jgi:hypothetical protein